MWFAIGIQHLWVPGSKYASNPACTESNPRPMSCMLRFRRLLILEFVPRHYLGHPPTNIRAVSALCQRDHTQSDVFGQRQQRPQQQLGQQQ